MAFFTSMRERRLWACVLATLIAIGASAVFAGILVDTLRSETLLGVAFAAGLALAVAAVVGIALTGGAREEVWVVVAVSAAFLMIPVRSGVVAIERTHLFEYGLLAVLCYEALAERKMNGRSVRLPGLVAILASTFFGWLDEAVQGLVPTRVYDLRDVGINALAAIVAVGAFAALRWGRERVGGIPARVTTETQNGAVDSAD